MSALLRGHYRHTSMKKSNSLLFLLFITTHTTRGSTHTHTHTFNVEHCWWWQKWKPTKIYSLKSSAKKIWLCARCFIKSNFNGMACGGGGAEHNGCLSKIFSIIPTSQILHFIHSVQGLCDVLKKGMEKVWILKWLSGLKELDPVKTKSKWKSTAHA